MKGQLVEPLPFAYDRAFESDLKDMATDDKRRAEDIATLCEQIRCNPFKGEMKQWAMDGLYGLHSGPFVILYELNPHLSPNHDPNEVEEVYFFRVVHHDDQQTAVKNVSRAERTTYVSIRLDYDQTPNVQRVISQLHETDEFRFEDANYDGGGVSIQGELVDDTRGRNQAILTTILPDTAPVEFDQEGFSDFL